MSSIRTRIQKGFLLIGGCTLLTTGLAGGPEAPSVPVVLAPAMPGVSLYGLGGNGWTGIGDAMLPIFGHPLNFFYLDPQIYYHSDDSEYTASAGGGGRWLTDNAGILGAYVFGDYNHSRNGNGFWFVSPGVERLGRIIDFSANLYIPVTHQTKDSGIEFADDAGDFSQISFAGHNQYDALVNTFDATGWGGDAQIGVKLPYRNVEIYFGGYYFTPKSEDDISGGSIRLQVPINNYFSALFSEAYDSEYHNTLKGGLTFWFGGRQTLAHWNGDLSQRLVDPIQRNLIAVAGGSHTGQPIVRKEEIIQQGVLELSNISFFIPETNSDLSAVQGDGTFENPYVGMSQDNIDHANSNNNFNFYINSGIYNAVYGTVNPSYLVLNNDQLYGRQNEFKQAASGSNRPLINFSEGGFAIPSGDRNDSFNDLRLMGQNQNGSAGIWINHEDGASNQIVNINQTDISYFGDGVDILNAADNNLTVNINNSLISNNGGGGELVSLGAEGGIAIINNNGGATQINVKNSTISNNNYFITDADTPLQAVGGLAAVNTLGAMTLNIENSHFTNNDIHYEPDSFNSNPLEAAGGLAAFNSAGMILHIQNSDFSENKLTATTNANLSTAGGLAAFNQGDMDLTIDHSHFDNNDINSTASLLEVSGGMAVYNQTANNGTSPSTMNLDINDSSFSNNRLNSETSAINTEGGFAILNENQSNLSLNLNNSDVSHNIINSTGDSSSISVGGLSVTNQVSNAEINISNSNFSNNLIDVDFSDSPQAVGGMAISSNGLSTLILDINRSQFNNNAITMSGSGSPELAIGGFAIHNRNSSNASIKITQSIFADNDINAGSIGAAGGMAVVTLNDMNLNISSSTFSGNNVNVINGIAAGGLAVDGFSGNMTIGIDGSNFSENNITFNGSLQAAGGFAAFNGNSSMSVAVKDSRFSENTVTSSGSANASGGIAFSNNGDLTADIKNSQIVRNFTHSEATAVAGGIAVNSLNAEAVTEVNIDKSKILFNDTGISVNSNISGNQATIIFDQSILAGNITGLSAINNSKIDVTNPIFFDGTVYVDTASVINFPSLSINPGDSGQRVRCIFGICKIVD